MRWFALTLAAALAGCVVESTPVYDRYADPPAMAAGDPDGAAYVVADATIELTPGVSVGYYVTYASGGHWSVRWTCDSYASGFACSFDGAVVATEGDSLTNLTPYQLEGNDSAWMADKAGSDAGTEIDYSAVATVGLDGFDFDAPAGAKITFDLLMDGFRYWQFVFFPSADPADPASAWGASPYAMPVTLLPTSP